MEPAAGKPTGPSDLDAAVKIQVLKSWDAPETGSQFTTGFKIKLALWSLVVLALIGAAIGLSVTLAVLHKNSNTRGSPTLSPPPGTPVASPPPPVASPPPGTPVRPPPPTSPTNPPPPGSSPPPPPGSSPPPPASATVIPTPSGVAPFNVPSGWKAIWWDEFEGDSLNTDFWSYDAGNGDWGWGNGEVEYYTTDNLAVTNGQLQITARSESMNGFSYTSSRINSNGKVLFYPGVEDPSGAIYDTIRLEASIKAPTPGQGFWPALWCSPTVNTYGVWPASGEIDIFEMINAMTRANQGLHYGGGTNKVKTVFVTRSASGTTYADAFHTYSIDWSATSIAFSVDGVVVETLYSKSVDPSGGWFTTAENAPTNAPFDIPFYIIVNFALGGNWAGAPNASSPLPATMFVDYIRIFGKTS